MSRITADEARELLERAIAESPYISFSNITVEAVDVDADELTLSMPTRPELMRGSGVDGMFHGGGIAALIDTAGDFVVAVAVGGVVPTINFRVDYLRPATGVALKAVARLRKAGRTVGVADVDVLDANGRLCAVGRGTYSGVAG